MKKALLNLGFFSALVLVFATCGKETIRPELNLPVLPDQPYSYSSETPENFRFVQTNTPEDNAVTDHGATLGRVLFYDAALSLNNTVSCGTCHKQEMAFADGKMFSEGFETKMTTRNSMAIFNHQFANGFFWDMRQTVLEDQVLDPVANHIEMGIEEMEYLVPKIQNIDYYPELFENAFGTPEVTEERLRKALAQFIRSIVSYDTKFDEGEATEFANFTAQEMRGKQLFSDHNCSVCHSSPTFTQQWSAEGINIGLDQEYEDQGMAEWSGESHQVGSFKVPSLRNIELTAPYMHDGRFATLDEVINFYNEKIQPHPNLNFFLTSFSWGGGVGNDVIFPGIGFPGDFFFGGNGGPPIRMQMTNQEKKDLKAFLLTLTDETMTKDPKYSNPFR